MLSVLHGYHCLLSTGQNIIMAFQHWCASKVTCLTWEWLDVLAIGTIYSVHLLDSTNMSRSSIFASSCRRRQSHPRRQTTPSLLVRAVHLRLWMWRNLRPQPAVWCQMKQILGLREADLGAEVHTNITLFFLKS